ncbi:phage head closure protein [Acinetobacter sp. SwsAc6]|uniref:phage head closure protein n=1 Tax=Acinetobacter sp. SwsAc6 TaxID=2749439 RepID=UPI0015BBD663|nr:phage head closure protein [Acinetobacter sp. SwsAc6]NWK74156.1 phage head closure protein [Acinetobacter sp. SwsAc6]
MGSLASELRHRVVIQQYVDQRDQYNNSTGKVWSEYKTLWGKLSGFSGKDLIAAKAAGSEVIARLKLRKRDDITTEMRVLFKGKAYQITSPPMPDDRDGNTYMTLMLSLAEEPL